MITLKNYSVHIWDKTIIPNLTYEFKKWSITALLGKNWSGKTSLALSLAWHPLYEVRWEMYLNTTPSQTLSPNERQQNWLFLSFQNIPEIPWISVLEYLRTIYNTQFSRQNIDKKSPSLFIFKRLVEKLLPDLQISSSLLEREMNVGFSGWEKRKLELLQAKLLDPEILIFDEVDSGLDINTLEILIQEINNWKKLWKTLIIISHNFSILKKLDIDYTLILQNGNIAQEWNKNTIIELEKSGFKHY